MIYLGFIVKEVDVFINYLKKKDFKLTAQRKMILNAFLNSIPHISAEELHRRLKHNNRTIGLATVYRTLKLLSECGLAGDLRLKDGITRYEPVFGHQHHDHLIRLECGRIIEVVEPEIAELQQKLAPKNSFKVLSHRMELYGTCEACNKKPSKSQN